MVKDSTFIEETRRKYESLEFGLPGLVSAFVNKHSLNLKENGAVYTPDYIVDFMIGVSKIGLTDTIIEPSCGHGAFIFGLLEYFRKTFHLSGAKLYHHFKSKVTAMDLSNDAISDLQEMLSIYFGAQGFLVPSSNFTNVISGDSLYETSIQRHYNHCIGNPPYVRTRNINSEYLGALRERFQSCKKGNIDLYYAFVEKFVNIADKLCFITPNSFLSNKSGKTLRMIIGSRLELLIDFREKQVFSDVGTYTAIFLLSKEAKATYSICNNLMDPLVLITKSSNDFLNVNKASIKQEKYRVLSGIATLRDNLYRVKKEGKRFIASDSYEIEPTFVIPFYKFTKRENEAYILCPYDHGFKVVSEESIEKNAPKTYSYFKSVQESLSERDKGNGKYEAWYAYGRKQGFGQPKSREVVIIPQMIGGKSIPYVISTNALRKESERFLFVSGFIIDTDDIEVKNFFMSDAFMSEIKKVGTPYPGKDAPYYAVKATQLRNMFL